jgi:hypothetical protein
MNHVFLAWIRLEVERGQDQATTPADREDQLEQIYVAEQQLAPSSTELFDRTRRANPRQPAESEHSRRPKRARPLYVKDEEP